jgi:hypothetical protein
MRQTPARAIVMTRRARRAWSSWTILALLPTVAPAALEVELRGGQGLATAAVVAERSSESARAESARAVRVVTETSSATLDLEPGEWTVTADVPGYWSTSEELTIEVQGDQQIALHLWPSGTLEGRVRGPADTELPAALDLVWSLSPGEEKGLPSASTVCPVTDGRWKCELPAGRLDLFLGAAGYIHQYRWDVPVRAGHLARLRDAIVLRRGSAIRGWVTTEEDRAIGGAEVEVAPRIAGSPAKQGAADRIRARKLTTEVTERGFFQVDGVAPGAYVVRASKDGYLSAPVSVRVRENETSEINRPPLILRKPRTLEVYVDPPTPPVGEAWVAELSQVDRHGRSLDVTFEGVVPPGGAWRVEGATDGRYSLDVRTTSDRPEPGAGVPAWHRETVEVAPETTQIFVTVTAIAISGRLTLGDEPIEGKLIFGTQHGLQRRSMVTDADGEFSGWLPRAGLWDIDVVAETPRIKTKVQEEIEDGDEIEIAIPDTRLSGDVVEVVDQRSRPAANAIVSIRSQGQLFQIFADDYGEFETAGLPAGLVSVRATAHRKKSEVRNLLLEDGSEESGIVLVLRPTVTRSGRVVAPNGAGVAGAQVGAFVVEDALKSTAESEFTDEEGRFLMELPDHARSLLLTVAAPGFAFRALRASASEEPLIIPVAQESGTLTLRLSESYSQQRWSSTSLFLLHEDGGLIYPTQLMMWAALQDRPIESPKRIVAPSMAPGRYSACWVGADQGVAAVTGNVGAMECVSGTLSTFGELTLDVAEPEGS